MQTEAQSVQTDYICLTTESSPSCSILRLVDMLPLTSLSFLLQLWSPKKHLPISISMKLASSGRARGSTPGSLKLVLSSIAMTKRKRTTAKTGMAAERWTARYGHLQIVKMQTLWFHTFHVWFKVIQLQIWCWNMSENQKMTSDMLNTQQDAF